VIAHLDLRVAQRDAKTDPMPRTDRPRRMCQWIYHHAGNGADGPAACGNALPSTVQS
jgi:hypothetical protein